MVVDLRIDLADSRGNRLSYCANAAEEVVAAIRANPADYYVIVHNPTFPAGAIRAQLGTDPAFPRGRGSLARH